MAKRLLAVVTTLCLCACGLLQTTGVKEVRAGVPSLSGGMRQTAQSDGIEKVRTGTGVFNSYTYDRWDGMMGPDEVEITGYTGNDTDLVIPEEINGYKVVSIGFRAFENCKSLKSVAMPAGISYIDSRAFAGCSSLRNVKLPQGLEKVSSSVFMDCISLTDIELPSSLRSTSEMTFAGCTGLSSIYLPAGMKVYGSGFVGCDSLEKIEVGVDHKYYKSVDGVLLSKDGTTLIACPAGKSGDFVIPSGVNQIETRAFAGSTKLKSLKIPAHIRIENMQRLGLEHCWNLAEIQADPANPDIMSSDGIIYSKDGKELLYCPPGKTGELKFLPGVERIGEYAFDTYHGMDRLVLPSSVTSINYNAFANSSIGSITLPAGVKEIYGGVFAGCENLKEIILDETNPYFTLADGILYDKNMTRLLSCPDRRTGEVNIPESVTQIGMRAFAGNKNLKNLKLPSGVKKIERSAFSECVNLKDIQIPSGLADIRTDAFTDCTSLVSFRFPDNMEMIYSNAFTGCENLTSIYVPVSAKSFDIGLFNYYNPSLKYIYYEGSKEQWKQMQLTMPLMVGIYFKRAVIYYNSTGIGQPGQSEPDTPDIPQRPTVPDQPDTPSRPVPSAPQKPSNPDQPDSTDRPSGPQQPDQPQMPSVPVKPEEPSPDLVTVSFDAQGGLPVSDLRIGRGTGLTWLPVPVRDGYTFQGWYTGRNGTGAAAMYGTLIYGNCVYYAHWLPAGRVLTDITASVSGTPYAGGSVSSVLIVHGIYTDGSYERVYDFHVSQSVLSPGSNMVTVTYRGCSRTVSILAVSADYPQGSRMVKQITAVYNGGSLLAGTYPVIPGLTVRAEYADGAVQNVEGYTLSSHRITKGSNHLTISYGGKTADIYINGYQYATVNLGNVSGMSGVWITEGQEILQALKNCIPSKSGYVFMGWYLDEACTQKVTESDRAGAGTSVYAKWEKISDWSLNRKNMTLKKGKKQKLSVTGMDSRQISWRSSNNKIATVSRTGMVKAKKKGKAVITAVTKDGTVMTCRVKVKK